MNDPKPEWINISDLWLRLPPSQARIMLEPSTTEFQFGIRVMIDDNPNPEGKRLVRVMASAVAPFTSVNYQQVLKRRCVQMEIDDTEDGSMVLAAIDQMCYQIQEFMGANGVREWVNESKKVEAEP